MNLRLLVGDAQRQAIKTVGVCPILVPGLAEHREQNPYNFVWSPVSRNVLGCSGQTWIGLFNDTEDAAVIDSCQAVGVPPGQN